MIKNTLYILFALLFMINTQAQVDRSKQPTPGAAPSIKIGKPETFTLKNGLKVLVVENHKLPRVSMDLSLDNPPQAEGEKVGVKELAGSIIGQGTSTISKDDFYEQIDYLGARIYFSVSGANAYSLSKYFDNVLNLMSKGILDPKFSEEEFQKEKDKLLEGLKADEKNVQAISGNVRNALAYGKNHPFGEFITPESAEKVTFDDAVNYYQQNFVPENAYLVIVGDVKFKDVKKKVTKAFKSWEAKTMLTKNFPDPENLAKTTINFVDVPNAVQSEVAAINVTNLKYTDKDFHAALLANDILGGGGEARLFLNLREKHGWTYGSYARLGKGKYISTFRATASVRNEVTDSAIVELMNEIKRIGIEPVTDEELAVAKAKYIGNFVIDAEKPETIARMALRTETQPLPENYYQNYIKNIQAVTAQDVMNAAKKYFSYDNARIVVVGKAQDVQEKLENMGYPIKYFDKNANEIERPVLSTPIPEGVTAQTVLNDYVKAVGGVDKIKAVKTFSAEFDMTGAAPVPLTGNDLFMAPNKTKLVMMYNGTPAQTLLFDGTTMKISGMGGSSEQSGDDVAEQVARKGFIPEAYYDASTAKLVGIEKVNDSNAYKMEYEFGGKKSYKFYDVASGLLVQEQTTEESPQGTVTQTSILTDYQEVGGIKIPAKKSIMVVMGEQSQNMEFTYKNIKINGGDVSDANFK